MIFTKYKEGVRAIRAQIKYKKYEAGKYTRAQAPLGWEYTKSNIRVKRWYNKYEHSELD